MSNRMATRRRATQRGWVLPSVMAWVLLVSLAGWAQARQLWLQEQVLKLQAQRLRHRALAQASVHAAWQDVVGQGAWEQHTPEPTPSKNLRHDMGDASASHVFFPRTIAEREVLRTRLNGHPCRDGVCVTDPPPGSSTSGSSATALPSPSLEEWMSRTAWAWPVSPASLPDESAQAWYWVEVIVNASDLSPAPNQPMAEPRFYYRITSLVSGGLPGSRAALQVVWQRDPAADASFATSDQSARILSWHWLTP